MTPTAFSTQIRAARYQRNFLGLISIIVVIALAAQSVHMARTTNQVVLVPTRVSDGMVARGSVDIRYLQAMATDAVLALYQTSPATLAHGRDVLERMASPSSRAALLAAYDKAAKDIETRKISTVFRVSELGTDLDALTVAVTGQFDTYLREQISNSETRTILVQFAIEAASARIVGIQRKGEAS